MLIQPSRDTLIRHRFQHDSVFVLHEKTTHKGLTLTGSKSEQIRVDTVILKQTEYRYRQVHDTIRVAHTDTVPYPVEVIREVPSPIPRAYRYCMWFAIIVLLYWLFRIAKVVYLRR